MADRSLYTTAEVGTPGVKTQSSVLGTHVCTHTHIQDILLITDSVVDAKQQVVDHSIEIASGSGGNKAFYVCSILLKILSVEQCNNLLSGVHNRDIWSIVT